MIERQEWVDHKFNLGIDPGWHFNVVSRVQDTQVRIASIAENLTDEELSRQIDGKWSLKEHIGHLIDLEQLHSGRLDQFRNKIEVLNMADMSHAKTEAADHNGTSLADLLNEFEAERKALIDNFYSLSDDIMRHEAEHPRLKVNMRPVDLMFFVAEHDDHHIVWMKEIRMNLNKGV